MVHSGVSKMTVMIFQLEGNDGTLQEGFRTISNAVSRVLPVTQTRALPVIAGTQSLSDAVDALDTVDAAVVEESGSQTTGTNKSAKRTVKSPQVVDLDLSSGDEPLAQFLNSHPVDE